MSRRDTILIAVLVNAGLLLVLFATALKTPQQEAAAAAAPPAPALPPPVEHAARSDAVAARGDEVDLVIQQFASAAPVAPTPQKNFAEDLRAITLPSPEAPAAPECVEVVVKKGDSLDKIARAHGTSAQEIMKASRLTTANLQIGQVLQVPRGKKGAASSAQKPAEKFYIVKNGDNPWTIAVKNHMKVEELLKLNQLDEEKARRLKPGDQLRIQ
jgi:LysM repeat protein